jgi:hypothetical protein
MNGSSKQLVGLQIAQSQAWATLTCEPCPGETAIGPKLYSPVSVPLVAISNTVPLVKAPQALVVP